MILAFLSLIAGLKKEQEKEQKFFQGTNSLSLLCMVEYRYFFFLVLRV